MKATWPKVRLGEVLQRSDEILVPTADTQYREITVRLWGRGVIERGRVDDASLAGTRRYLARSGQFIVSRIDARNGAMGIVTDELDGAVVTNDFPLFDLRTDRLVPSYLGWLSRTRELVALCQRASEGTTNRVRLKEDRFLALDTPLPPLAEQRRVVARIEELAAQIHDARTLRRHVAEESDALILSRTSSLFDGLRGFARVPIRTLGVGGKNPVQTGPFGAQLHASEFAEEGIPVLNVGNVWPEGLRLDRLDHVGSEKAAQLSRYSLQPDDLLFARSGATLGKVCLVPKECAGWLMTGHLFRVRFDQSRVFCRFAFAALRGARSIHEQVFGQVRGATRPGYNTKLLGNVQIPLPPVSEQHRIVAELDALQLEVDRLKCLQAETAAELDALLPAVLDRTFTGEV